MIAVYSCTALYCTVLQYIFLYVGPTFSAEFFDELVAHISSCIRSYRDTVTRDQRKALLETLFDACDHVKVS